jgi:hypothetical protein
MMSPKSANRRHCSQRSQQVTITAVVGFEVLTGVSTGMAVFCYLHDHYYAFMAKNVKYRVCDWAMLQHFIPIGERITNLQELTTKVV